MLILLESTKTFGHRNYLQVLLDILDNCYKCESTLRALLSKITTHCCHPRENDEMCKSTLFTLTPLPYNTRGPPLILCRTLCKRLSERSVGRWMTHATDTLFPNNYTIQSLPDSLVPLLLCTKEEEFISVIVMLRTLSIVRISRCYRPLYQCTVTKPALFHNVVLKCTPQNHIYRNKDM